MQVDNFTSLAVLHLNAPSHMLPSSCSPDKDLLLVISRLGVKDTISLWKMQGGKKWEVDVSVGSAAHEQVTGVAWAPDGMSILIAHHPPRLSIHSIQDGRQERSISFPSSSSTTPVPATDVDFRVTSVWWFKHENPPTKIPEMPDFFKRNKTIPGSALSQLTMQPLLDPLKDDTQPITTSDLFSFQGTLPTSSAKAPKLPPSIADWPALPSDPIAASIKPFPRPGDPSRTSPEVLDDVRVESSLNYDSLVVAADDRGRCHFFMDATFPLGHLSLVADSDSDSEEEDSGPVEVVSLVQVPYTASFLAHVSCGGHTNLAPLVLDLAALRTSQAREIARASSAARELTWYMLRAIDEMRAAWVGSAEHGEGARALGPRWIKDLEAKQRAHVASSTGNDQLPIFDLTLLLTTGRASEALNDLLAGLSDRGLAKWDTTMTEAFFKLRDFAEKRLAPAAQRLYIILQEAKGWAMLPQLYAVHRFDEWQITQCLELVTRAIELSAWLASAAREQLWRWKEFKLWLQYESGKVHTEEGKVRPLSWDVLEVNRYLVDGAGGCSLDKWFDLEGEDNRVPDETPADVRVWGKGGKTLEAVIKEARRATDDPSVLKTEYAKGTRENIEDLDRNLEQLVKEIGRRCRRVFDECGIGMGEGTRVNKKWKGMKREVGLIRMGERTLMKDGTGTEYTLAYVAGTGDSERQSLFESEIRILTEINTVCLSRIHIGLRGSVERVEGLKIECKLGDVEDFAFFDEESIIVVLRRQDDVGLLGMFGYRELEYVEMERTETREEIVEQTMRMGSGGVLELGGVRRLGVRGMSVAVNGRVGRRTVSVMDGKGMEVEVVDMAEEEE